MIKISHNVIFSENVKFFAIHVRLTLIENEYSILTHKVMIFDDNLYDN